MSMQLCWTCLLMVFYQFSLQLLYLEKVRAYKYVYESVCVFEWKCIVSLLVMYLRIKILCRCVSSRLLNAFVFCFISSFGTLIMLKFSAHFMVILRESCTWNWVQMEIISYHVRRIVQWSCGIWMAQYVRTRMKKNLMNMVCLVLAWITLVGYE